MIVYTLTTNSDSGIETTVHASVHDALENLRGCFKPEEVANVPDSELIDWAEEVGQMWVLLTQHELNTETGESVVVVEDTVVRCLCDAILPCPIHDGSAA